MLDGIAAGPSRLSLNVNSCRKSSIIWKVLIQGKRLDLTILLSNRLLNSSVICNYDLTKILFTNMIYGMGVMIYSRPSMRPINSFQRTAFRYIRNLYRWWNQHNANKDLSTLGSLMFCHSSMMVYKWLSATFSHRPYMLTFLGFISGRVMMVHLLAYLYHIDSRVYIPGQYFRRNADFESMYV